MNFDKLFNLLVEEDTTNATPAPEAPEAFEPINDDGTGVPEPDSYDVEPAAIPPVADHNENVQSLKSYIDKLSSFADELNSPNGNSLNDYVNRVDIESGGDEKSPYSGISSLGKKIISAAQDLRSLIEDLNGFRIAAQKKASAAKSVVPGPAAAAPQAPATPAAVPPAA
jgi:hypothetical protein